MIVVNTTKKQRCVEDENGQIYHIPPGRHSIPTPVDESKLPKGIKKIPGS